MPVGGYVGDYDGHWSERGLTESIHIAGIGGTFMAGLALIARECGYTIQGSDQSLYPPMSTLLAQEGIPLFEGYQPAAIAPEASLCVIGNALSRGNPLVEHILAQRLPYTSGPQWLRQTLIPARRVLAIAGTHGKTTTSSMASFILDRSDRQPGFLIGGIPGNFSSSARLGLGDWFVVEADEYDTAFFDKRSKFLHYRPDILVIGNVEFDHGDIFDSLEDIEKQFGYLLRSVPKDGEVIINADDSGIGRILKRGCWSRVTSYSAQDDTADWFAKPLSADCRAFDVFCQGQHVGTVDWNIMGAHNMLNALAAIASCRAVGVEGQTACRELRDFQLPKRRLERLNPTGSIALFDDFAHHPTAVRETLTTLRQASPSGQLIAVLEPRSNTMKRGDHQDDLASALSLADVAIVRQRSDMGWDPGALALHPNRTKLLVLEDINAIVDSVVKTARPGDQVVIMSNGSFDGLNDLIHQALPA
ncbi:MAG: UDP-N-acetylmuramate:L-alanyl-gamma-D-glutamyl-meso-diaminopimelate ligase [Gammaproteobacteria bacterium]|nr:UDP-N-acetylmuramate:L-alanyl-gamma-D-glutamyl-meso-diaminopimelate ligase [Gammaproteobacteria bacterium]